MAPTLNAVRWVVYILAVVAAIALPILIFFSQSGFGLWYGVVPIACIVFLSGTEAKVEFRWGLFVEDLRRSWKFLACLLVYNVAICLVAAYFMRDLGISPGLHPFSFELGNIVEELFFRATLIALFELLERRLFDSVNRMRVIAATSAAFGLSHIGQVLNATILVARYIAIENVMIASVIGMFFGDRLFQVPQSSQHNRNPLVDQP